MIKDKQGFFLNYNNHCYTFKHYSSWLEEQRGVFKKKKMEVVNNQKGGVFFLYGHGGTWKTYMRRTLASYIRSKNKLF